MFDGWAAAAAAAADDDDDDDDIYIYSCNIYMGLFIEDVYTHTQIYIYMNIKTQIYKPAGWLRF